MKFILSLLFSVTISLTWLAVVVSSTIPKERGRIRMARTLHGNSNNNHGRKLSTIDSREGSITTLQIEMETENEGNEEDLQLRAKPSSSSDPRKCDPNSGKGRSCGPTSSPNVPPSKAPSITTSPTIDRAESPAFPLTKEPTSQPTVGPTPNAPSITTSPTIDPAESPTFPPTKEPTTQPTVGPSPNPTDPPPFLPFEQPNLFPSLSMNPSGPQTQLPSLTPSLSLVPTQQLFDTDDNELVSTCPASDFMPLSSSEGGISQEETLAFQYAMFVVPSADTDEQIYRMERLIHFALSWHFLQCDLSNDESSSGDGESPELSFDIIAIDSKPTDTAAFLSCDALSNSIEIPDEPAKCVVVASALSMTVLYPDESRRRHLEQYTTANEELRNVVGEYLNDSMDRGDFDGGDIVQVTFLGFINVDDGTTITGGGDATTVSEAIGGEVQSQQQNAKVPNIAASSVIVAAAAICLVVVGFVTVRHRRKRQDAYLRHLEELSVDQKEFNNETFSCDSGNGHVVEIAISDDRNHDYTRSITSSRRAVPLDSDGKVEMVANNDNDGGGIGIGGRVNYNIHRGEVHQCASANINSDVHQCASATCRICRQREMRPEFVRTNYNHEHEKMIADLGKYYRSPADRLPTLQVPRTPNTVDL